MRAYFLQKYTPSIFCILGWNLWQARVRGRGQKCLQEGKEYKAVCVAKVARASGESTAGSLSLEDGMSPERPQGPLCLGTFHEVEDKREDRRNSTSGI